ncbi:class 3 adenylate cyclase [Bradyrhizobium sp. GM24.11]
MNIAEWLHGLGLERYSQAFQDGEVTPEILPELTEDDLRELGLPLGPRKAVLKAIHALALSSGPISAEVRASAEQPKLPLPSEADRRQLTVMFVDLVGSTALASGRDPEEVRDLIQAYHNTVASEITRFEGHVAKFLGDGVLAYFGWPRAHEDEAERAVRAGLRISKAVAALTEPTGAALAARVGIATGLVVVGELIGEGEARERSVIGETPNLAARLQGLADPGGVVIADSTHRLIGEAFLYQDLGTVPLKGFPGPVQAWLVTGEGAAESRFDAQHGMSTTALVRAGPGTRTSPGPLGTGERARGTDRPAWRRTWHRQIPPRARATRPACRRAAHTPQPFLFAIPYQQRLVSYRGSP